jgi:O-antigen/teichoic acid export membrane protein
LVFQLSLLVRSAGFALPEMVIALERDAAAGSALRRFSTILAGATLGAMLLLALTPVADFYFQTFQSATDEVASLARTGVRLLIPLPPFVVLICWLRGGLMRRRETRRVNRAVLVRMGVFLPVLGGGLLFGWPSLVTAAWALDLSVLAELLYLLAVTRGRRSL